MKYQTTKTTIGNICIGGEKPVMIQSMTTTTTTDVEATVDEAIRIYEAGARLVRITAQGVKEAEALREIKSSLHSKGYHFPISADIHFNYKAAYAAAKYVDKVRINPGNFVPHKDGEPFEDGVLRIKERFIPLLDLCKQDDVALRIGVNHGSLSERMTIKYGDTPRGIVESCLEYLSICKEQNFHNLVISIKSSNTVLMVKAVRLLVTEMQKSRMAYPLHLGVTEAGEGEDGRLKSSVGIGTLLNQGLGDTIRVSLTEAPECEPPVAQKIIDFTHKGELTKRLNTTFKSRKILEKGSFSNANPPAVLLDLREKVVPREEVLGYSTKGKGIRACDYVIVDKFKDELPESLHQIVPEKNFRGKGIPLFTAEKYIEKEKSSLSFVALEASETVLLQQFSNENNAVLLVKAKDFHQLEEFCNRLLDKDLQLPVIVSMQSDANDLEDLQISAACLLGNCFIDRWASGILLECNALPLEQVRETAFGILQATRARTTKTEFISCPGCGRTLFNLQSVTAKVKAHFQHLNHLKIGVMGCIVNGPGEMGDADYGYVGAGKSRITLYKRHEVMKRNVPSEKAIEELVDLIKEHGDWVEPNSDEN